MLFTDMEIERLGSGRVGVIPTDTVYGIVGQLLSEDAVRRIYDVKQRDLTKPVGTILIASPAQIMEYVPFDLLEKAKAHWPGPVSVVLPVDDRFAYAHGGLRSLAFRMPDHPELVRLLEYTGPLATSSANLQSNPPANTVNEAEDYFCELIDFYVDGGDLSNRSASRIISFDDSGQTIEIRP